MKHIAPHQPGSELLFNLAGVNNLQDKVSGSLRISLLDSKGNPAIERKMEVSLKPQQRSDIMVSLDLPEQAGGYLLVAEFTPEGSSNVVISRRYIRIGILSHYSYFELQPEDLEGF
jgi:hypothetical protein